MDRERYRSKIKFLLFVIGMFLVWYLGRFFHLDTETIQNSLARFPRLYSGIFFVASYVIITFFFWFSKDLFMLTSALLFGAAFSGLLIWIAETINAFILFYLARSLGRKFVEDYLKERYNRLDEKLGNLSFHWLFLFRAVPFIPYRFLDLSGGITSLSFKKYISAVILGSPFKIFWVQYVLAAVGKSVFDHPYALVEYFLNNRTLFLISLIYPLLILVIAFKINRASQKCRP